MNRPDLLGRRYQPDYRDYRLETLLPARIERPTFRYWRDPWVGDQSLTPPDFDGGHGYCVGFAWHGLREASPHRYTTPLPLEIYDGAQLDDEWPGVNYSGTSVRGGAKWLQAQGLVSTYRMTTDVEVVLDWLASDDGGPVVFGTDWLDSMWDPDSSGYLTVDQNASVVGGHAYLIAGYNLITWGALRVVNSWSREWGVNSGRAWLRIEDAAWLLSRSGEACAPTEV